MLAAEIGTVTFEAGLSHLHLALAVAEVHLGRPDEAAALVERAWQAGWADVRWLRSDPALQPLATHPAFVRVLGALGASPPIEIHVPAGLLADGG